MVNPAKKSEYRIYNVRDIPKLECVSSLESFVKNTFREFKDYTESLSPGMDGRESNIG